MMTSAHCSALARTEHAFPEASAELRAHLAGCDPCNARWRELDELAQLGRELPAPELTRDRRDAMRDAILARVSAKPRSRARSRPEGRVFWMAAAALLLAVAGILVGLTRGGDSVAPQVAQADKVRRGTVHRHGDARFVRVGKVGDEVVRLIDGTITVEVQPLQAGERFRVVTGDAEVEVRGTAFDVVAEDDHLKSVRVLHGRVEVRPEGGQTRLLGPAERWQAPLTDAARELPAPRPTAAAVEPPAADTVPVESVRSAILPAPPPPEVAAASAEERRDEAPARRSVRRPGRARHVAPAPGVDAGASDEIDAGSEAKAEDVAVPHEPLPVEASYQRGWDALRDGRAEDAAAEFAAVLEADPSRGLAEDASYWRAVALGRAPGRRVDAVMAFRAFLRSYPAAVRAAEASVMLGWLLVDEGGLDRAQVRFQAAAEAQDPAVRDSSRRGLAEVERRRAEAALPTP